MRLNPNETKRQYHQRRLEELKAVRNEWQADWSDLAAFIAPQQYRSHVNAERTKRGKIIDSTATFALRTLASGMHSGLTSPARPWFRLTTFDQGLKDNSAVKQYVASVESRMREVFQASNIYPAFHSGYRDLGLFGQFAGLLIRDPKTTIRMIVCQHGSFWLARDEAGIANTLYRQFSWTVEKIVARFGLEKCSDTIRQQYERGQYDIRHTVCHAVEPRHDRDGSKRDKPNKPFLSNYWEEGGGKAINGNVDGLLEESGFDANPIIAPAWEIAADDQYANSPGMDALPDVKMLQVMQMRKGEAIEKMVRPPMVGPTSLKGNPASLMPGAITYVDQVSGGTAFAPAMQVNLRIAELSADIQEVQQRIGRALYADLFLMLTNMEGIQPRNQFEIAERKEEKLLALGPVLENIYGGMLAPAIDRTYEAMSEAGMLPEPPPEIAGQELKIEYISVLAQAQKAVATGAIERLSAFTGNLAGINPNVLDKLNMDQMVDEYAEAIGVPPAIIVSDDEVAETRQARAQAQQAQEGAAMAAQMAPAAKQGAEAARLLSETDASNGSNLLEQLGIV